MPAPPQRRQSASAAEATSSAPSGTRRARTKATRSSCTGRATKRRRCGSRTTCTSGSSRRSTGCARASSWARTWCCCWALPASREHLAPRLVEVPARLGGGTEGVQRVRVVERVVCLPPVVPQEVEDAEVVPGLRVLRLALRLEPVIALRAREVLRTEERRGEELDRLECERIEVVRVARRPRGVDEIGTPERAVRVLQALVGIPRREHRVQRRERAHRDACRRQQAQARRAARLGDEHAGDREQRTLRRDEVPV